MSELQPSRCPQCSGPLQVSELRCPQCDLAIAGRFPRCRFCDLPPEQLRFLEVFLACRGVIRQIEEALGISYPTVRARIDELLEALRFGAPTQEQPTVRDVLGQLERGEISAEDAIAQVEQIRGKRR